MAKPTPGPAFKLQIVTPEGQALPPFPGGGTFERALVEDIALAVEGSIPALRAAIVARGVGFGRTEAHVGADVEAALREVLPDLVQKHVRDLLYSLKSETKRLI